MSAPRLWTPTECAERLQISREYLAQLRCRGGGPPFLKIGHQIRYIPQSVIEWAHQQERTTTRELQAW